MQPEELILNLRPGPTPPTKPMQSEAGKALEGLSHSEILSADTCLNCGGEKLKGYTLCTSCYNRLSPLLQRCLPRRVRNFIYIDQQAEISGLTHKVFRDTFKQALWFLEKRANEETKA